MLYISAGEKVLYKCRDVMLIQDSGGVYRVCTGGAGDTPRGFENPLEAWSCFIDTLDGRVRRRIGDMLENEGKNRYTGAPEGGQNLEK